MVIGRVLNVSLEVSSSDARLMPQGVGLRPLLRSKAKYCVVCSVVQGRNAVSAYFTSKQILRSRAVLCQPVYVVICRQANAQQILEKVRVLILGEILFADFFNK